jgi:hypothetical protein
MVKRPETLHNTVSCRAGMSSCSQQARWARGVVLGNGLMDDRKPSIAAASRCFGASRTKASAALHVERAAFASVAPQADETACSFFQFRRTAHRRFVAMGRCDRLRRIVRLVGTIAAAIARQTPTTK